MIRFLHFAADAGDRDDPSGRRASVKRALDIIIHLQARLKMNVGGEPARVLSLDLRSDPAGVPGRIPAEI
jgi:flagellar secretion chaperone FliS